MDLFFGLIIVAIVCILFITYVSIYNVYQSYIIRINEAESNIDSTLRKRFDLLSKSIGIIKASCDIDGEILENIVKLRSRKLSNFELDRQLYDSINEFNTYKEKYKELSNVESFVKIDQALTDSETEIFALRKYYNDIITKYNKMIRMFPSNIVARLCKYQTKTYFDGKNMEDEIINDFKL